MHFPTLIYGYETLVLLGSNEWKVRVVEMDNMHIIIGIKGIDKGKNWRKIYGEDSAIHMHR